MTEQSGTGWRRSGTGPATCTPSACSQASIVPSGDQVGDAYGPPGTTQRSAGSAGGGWLTPNRWIWFPPATAASRVPPWSSWPCSSDVPSS